jgi:hypothetical protein
MDDETRAYLAAMRAEVRFLPMTLVGAIEQTALTRFADI